MERHLNNLPPELLLRIFAEIEPIKQIVTCKLVCKRWHSILTNLRLKSLVISGKLNLSNNKWWYSYDNVNCKHLIKNDQSLESIKFKLSQSLFNNLRSLYIYNIHDKILFTCFLNEFKQLHQLEVIYCKLKSETNSECVLNLRNLRILNIGDSINGSIVLNTPKLDKVKLNLPYIDKITFKYPENVKLFETLRYNDQIKNFVNLEYLFVKNINSLEDNFLENFNRLKEIHFDTKKEIFHILNSQKRRFAKNELKLFYFGVNLEENIPNYELKNSRHQINKKAIELFGDYYSKLATVLPFVHQIDYCDLEEYFNDQVPRCFIKRFVNLDYLIVTRKVNYSNQLIQILNDCGNLKSLAIDSSLDQQIFNNLTSIQPNLEYLMIRNEQKLNFNEFLLNFNSLELIYIKDNLSIDFVQKIINKYKNLIFSFIYHAKNVRILSHKNDEFKLEIENQNNANFDNLDDLFTHLKFNLNF